MPRITSLNKCASWDCIRSSPCQTYSLCFVSRCSATASQTYPLSRTNSDSHTRSLVRSKRLACGEKASISPNPSISKALPASMQSALAIRSRNPGGRIVDEGSTILFKDKSRAMVNAVDRYAQVRSLVQCRPGAIQGMLTMKAKTISTERKPENGIRRAKLSRWMQSRLHKAAIPVANDAEAARTDVNRNAERDRTKPGVCRKGSKPHLV